MTALYKNSRCIMAFLLIMTVFGSCTKTEESGETADKSMPLASATCFTAKISCQFTGLSDKEVMYGSFGALFSDKEDAESAFLSWADGNDRPDCLRQGASSIKSGGQIDISLTGLTAGTKYRFCVYFKSEDGTERLLSEFGEFVTCSFAPAISECTIEKVRYYDAFISGTVSVDSDDAAMCKAGITWAGNVEDLLSDSNRIESSVNADGSYHLSVAGLATASSYFFRPYVKAGDTILYGDIQSFTTLKIDDMAVDMGLSVKWANCDFMAQEPVESGECYSWGALESYHKGTLGSYVHYTSNGYSNLGSSISGSEYDVVHVKYGGKWRMPTVDEVRELFENCSTKYVNDDEGSYLQFTAANGNVIKFDARVHSYVNGKKTDEFTRWTGSLETGGKAFILSTMDNKFTSKSEPREYEFCIRPVCEY